MITLRVILEGADKARDLTKYFILGLWKHAVSRSWIMNFAFMAKIFSFKRRVASLVSNL